MIGVEIERTVLNVDEAYDDQPFDSTAALTS